jgi:hypothetical protein
VSLSVRVCPSSSTSSCYLGSGDPPDADSWASGEWDTAWTAEASLDFFISIIGRGPEMVFRRRPWASQHRIAVLASPPNARDLQAQTLASKLACTGALPSPALIRWCPGGNGCPCPLGGCNMMTNATNDARSVLGSDVHAVPESCWPQLSIKRSRNELLITSEDHHRGTLWSLLHSLTLFLSSTLNP